MSSLRRRGLVSLALAFGLLPALAPAAFAAGFDELERAGRTGRGSSPGRAAEYPGGYAAKTPPSSFTISRSRGRKSTTISWAR